MALKTLNEIMDMNYNELSEYMKNLSYRTYPNLFKQIKEKDILIYDELFKEFYFTRDKNARNGCGEDAPYRWNLDPDRSWNSGMGPDIRLDSWMIELSYGDGFRIRKSGFGWYDIFKGWIPMDREFVQKLFLNIDGAYQFKYFEYFLRTKPGHMKWDPDGK